MKRPVATVALDTAIYRVRDCDAFRVEQYPLLTTRSCALGPHVALGGATEDPTGMC